MKHRGPLHAGFALALLGCGPAGGGGNADLAPPSCSVQAASALSTCGGDTRAACYAPGMSQPSKMGLFSVSLLSAEPGPPVKGFNTWVIHVTDAQSGASLDNLKLTAVPFMPDHGHGTSTVVMISAMGGGAYQLMPLNLFMAGLWQTTITLTAPDGRADQVVFSFCIEG